jgi:response regulator RpfG family c-di-GMP phosphodiesterase
MMNSQGISILIVDDDEQICHLLASQLSSKYTCITASSADEAAKILSATTFNLVLSDITMPGTSGLELCEMIQEKWPDSLVMMVSAMTEIDFAIEAMRRGAFDYLTKPFKLSQVELSIDRALRHQALLAIKRQYEQKLEEMVRERTDQLRQVNDDLNQTLEALYLNYRSTLRALAKALEARDVETGGHCDRVVAYCLRIGRELGLNHEQLIALEQGALLHDIGKIGVRDSILLKPGPLTTEEWTEMRNHINVGLCIIDGIDFLSGARPIVAQHHEKYDGSGYPAGLEGDMIHVNARIFAVADAFDAIRSDRPYRPAQSYAAARAEISANSGSHFDPKVVSAFLRVPEPEWDEIRRAAESLTYSEKIIDRQDIHAYVISLKGHLGGQRPAQYAS